MPIGFLWNGSEIVMCTAPSAPKVRALRERPAVAITIDEEDPPQKALLLRGTVAIDVVEGVPDEYIARGREADRRRDAPRVRGRGALRSTRRWRA